MADEGFSRKDGDDTVFKDAMWHVIRGKLTPSRGRPGKVKGLFSVVAEILFASLDSVRKEIASQARIYSRH